MADTENTETQDTEAAPETPPETPEAPPEAPEGQEAPPEEGEAEEPKEGEGAEGEDKDTAEAKPPEGQHKRAGGYQRKIERLEREREILLQQLQGQQRMGPPSQPAAPAKDKTPAEQAADYIQTMVRDQLAAERAAAQESQRQAEFQRRTAQLRAATPDFDEALEMAAHIPVSNALGHALLTSDKGPEIMYQLAKNPAELARISALPPLDAAREVGKLEAKAASGAAPLKPKAAVRPPAPPSTVGGNSSSARSLEDLPLSDYKRAYRSGRR